MFEALTSLLTVLEVVLSIDNLVVIAVLVGKLPRERQAAARYSGMTLALLPRLILLFFISWIIGLTEPLVTVLGHGVSGKDMILAAGGLFLIYKATQEIHASLEGEEGEASARVLSSFAAVVVQIALINLVFSIDSIVTAVGMANEIWVMAVAVILSMMVLMLASGPVAAFVEEHPTVKVLALGFLIMIGMALVADSFSAGVPKGYIYTAMIFSIFIEAINMAGRRKKRRAPVHLRNPYGEDTDAPGDEVEALRARRIERLIPRRAGMAAARGPRIANVEARADTRPSGAPGGAGSQRDGRSGRGDRGTRRIVPPNESGCRSSLPDVDHWAADSAASLISVKRPAA